METIHKSQVICSKCTRKLNHEVFWCPWCGYSIKVAPPIGRFDVLNKLIERHNYRSYLEIGLGPRDCGRSFPLVKAMMKETIDPNEPDATYQTTSDMFFENNATGHLWDLIFVDGLHHADQVLRDVANAEKHLSPGGAIVLHDCNPLCEESQLVPRLQGLLIWLGDVWKAWATLRLSRADLNMRVVDVDHGCGIIMTGNQTPITIASLEYETLVLNRAGILNLVSWEEFLNS